jgi:hypothetical protein
MQTILDPAFEPGGAARSRLIIPADELQSSAESVFKAAAQITAAEADAAPIPGDFPLYEYLSSVARAKGFQHCGTILLLIQRPDQAARVLALIREAIAALGGPGDFFDVLDLLTCPDGRPQ